MSAKIKIKRGVVPHYSSSKFFGETTMEREWLDCGLFSPTDVFLCRINLEDIKGLSGAEVLPSDGALFFFIDIESEPVDCKVLYSKTADHLVDFNEEADLDYDLSEDFAIGFSEGEKNTAMLVRDDKVYENETCLLRFTPSEFEEIDFLSDMDGSLYFVIETSALKKLDFSAAKVFYCENKKLCR